MTPAGGGRGRGWWPQLVAEVTGRSCRSTVIRWPSSPREAYGSEHRSDPSDDGLDPNEPVVANKPGPHATPWHPSKMSSPPVYKFCLLGGRSSGKSALVYRLTSRSFDINYQPTRAATQLFTKLSQGAHEFLLEIEDSPGIPGEHADAALSSLLRSLVWFEKRRRDRDEEPPAKLNGPDPLANAIASARKRMGFVVVANVDSASAFAQAHTIIERVFDRIEYDPHEDGISSPVAIVLVGTKADRSRSQREASPEVELRQEIQRRYAGSVGYLECSAAENVGIKEVFLEAVRRTRGLPQRHQIRAARAAGRGVRRSSLNSLVESTQNLFRR